MNNVKKAYISITLQSIIVGFSILLVKIALKHSNPLDLLAHRFTVAFIFFLIYKYIIKDNSKINYQIIKEVIPYTVFYPLLFFLTQVFGLKYLSSSQAGIITALSPIITLIAARILINEEVNFKQKVYMAISVAGVIYINIMNGASLEGYSYLGFFLTLASCISFSIYNVVTKKLVKKYSLMTIVYVMMLECFVVFNGISLVQHFMNGNIQDYFVEFTHLPFLLSVLYLGTLAAIITSTLTTYALKTLDSTIVGLFNNVTTVVSIVAGVIFLHDKLYYYHYIGIAITLFGAIAFNLVNKK